MEGAPPAADCPDHLACGICHEPIWTPVSWGTGQIACRSCAEAWFVTSNQITCPFTRAVVAPLHLLENQDTMRLEREVHSWAAENGVKRETPLDGRERREAELALHVAELERRVNERAAAASATRHSLQMWAP